jgi:hypothetical protein
VAKEIQLKEQERRHIEGAGATTYQVGDHVLVDPNNLHFKESKLAPPLKGPYTIQTR